MLLEALAMQLQLILIVVELELHHFGISNVKDARSARQRVGL